MTGQGIRSGARHRALAYAEKQTRIISQAENPGPSLVPIRTPTIVFCRNARCLKRLLITDQDVKSKDFVICPLCGAPYPLYVKPGTNDKRRPSRS